MKSTPVSTIVLVILLTVWGPLAASQASGSDATRGSAPPVLSPPPPVTTEHTITTEGRTLTYRATVGYLTQHFEKETPQAHFFYTAYVMKGADPARRPLTFCFNGGPGSSSFYLHLLTIGPRRAVLTENGDTPAPPPRLEDNPDTWLAVSDIVMVDPIGTGFSRPAPGVDGKIFWGVHEDARSVADFVRMFLTENSRWLSPIYIAGESYGGIRGALLARELQTHNQIGLDINGLITISPALDLNFVFVRDHDALGLALYVPTYCATAWFHRKTDPKYRNDFNRLEADARAFAYERYLPALLRGNRLLQTDMEAVAREMVSLTGLSLAFILHHNLRITPEEFRAELLRERRLPLDRIDARFKSGTFDLTQTLSPLINHYLREELGYRTPRPYTNHAAVFTSWKWDPFTLTVLPQLAETMNDNPAMKVFCAAGYYDFACPFSCIDHCLDQLQLDAGLTENIIRKYYHAGHMVYIPSAELKRFNDDVKRFIRSTSLGGGR